MIELSLTRNSFTHRGLTLSYLDSCPDDYERPVVMFLHGFPDSADMWTQQVACLHEQGYRCIAPDTVGCGHSQIAPKLRDYNARMIVEDKVALLDHLGLERVDVVGHDWGAILAWLVAGHYPQRVNHLVVMSVGHPGAYARAGLDQKLAGWYIAFFCLGGFAERLLAGKGRLSLRRVFGTHPHPDEVMARLSAPGRLRAALRIYRASLKTVLVDTPPAVSSPTLGVYSRGDKYLVESQMRNSERWVNADWTYQVLDGGHWIPLEKAQELNQLLVQFLSAPPSF